MPDTTKPPNPMRWVKRYAPVLASLWMLCVVPAFGQKANTREGAVVIGIGDSFPHYAFLGETGEHRRIYDKWLGVMVLRGVSTKTVLTYIALAIAPLLLLLMVSVIWSRSLKTQVAQRTRDLHESGEQFRRAVVDAPFPIMIHAENGEVLQINKTWTDLTGYTLEDIPTISEWTGKAYGEQGEVAGAFIAKLYSLEERVSEGDYEITTRNGKKLTWEFSSAPLGMLPDGRRSVISMAVDITDRKQAEEQFRLVIETAPSGMVIVGRDGDILFANKQMEELFGYTSKEMIGQPVELLVPERFREGHPEKRDGFLKESVNPQRCMGLYLFGRRKDGTEFPVQIGLSSMQTPKGMVALGSILDTTERKRAEEELQAAHDELEARVDKRTAELSTANEFLRQEIANRERAEEQLRMDQDKLTHASRLSIIGATVSGLAHELNQPLSAVSTYADACTRMVESGNDGDLLETLGKLAGQAERAGKIIHRVRRFIRKEVFQKSTVDLNALIRETLALVDPEGTVEGISISLELDDSIPLILADSTQIQQVIINLIRNALESMEQMDTRVCKLTIQSNASVDDMVRITVCDTGAGLEPEAAERLFEAFFTTKATGMGLGLSVSHAIVEVHGGQLWATPNSDSGTTFHLSLPIRARTTNDNC